MVFERFDRPHRIFNKSSLVAMYLSFIVISIALSRDLFLGGGNFPPNIETPPPRIFGQACREAKNNVNTRLTSLTKCLMF